MRAELLSATDSRWSDLLGEARHEFYHLQSYLELEAERIDGEPAALYAEAGHSRMLLPLVLRPVPLSLDPSHSLRDATSPYGYPGPLLVRAQAGFAPAAIDAAREVMRASGIVSVFVRLSPLLNDPTLLGERGVLTQHGDTIWLDLSLPTEELSRHLRSRYRSYLNGIDRDRIQVRFDADFEHYEAFVELYHATMRRVGAADWYFFSQRYFDRLREALGDRLELCVVTDSCRLVAAGLFASSGGVVEYLFSGVDIDAGQPHAMRLMIVFVRDQAKARGHSALHLGGGLGAREDSLFQFKRGFSKLRNPFHTWRWIVDPVAYDALAQRWAERSNEPPDDPTGFFPAYRKPGR